MGTGVEAFEGGSAVERVRTSDGRELECDFVVVGVGVEPRTGLAEAAGLTLDYGERIRVEHWANALDQGPAAARSMLGRDDAYERLPYFFSDQYDVGMEYSGFARNCDRVVLRGDTASREFIAFWLVGDRVVAGMNVNVWDVTEPIQALIRERVAVDDRRLADPEIPLAELAAGATRPGLRGAAG